MRSARRFFALCLVIVFVAFATSCDEGRTARELMDEFLDSYSAAGRLFSPEIPEGQEGHSTDAFFEKLYGDGREFVSDYAVFLSSDLESIEEAAVFVCYGEYDAMMVAQIAYRRIELIRSLGGSVNTDNLEEAFVFRKGRYVVMCLLEDNATAKRIWRSILR